MKFLVYLKKFNTDLHSTPFPPEEWELAHTPREGETLISEVHINGFAYIVRKIYMMTSIKGEFAGTIFAEEILASDVRNEISKTKGFSEFTHPSEWLDN